MPKARIELLGRFAALVDGEAVSERAWRLRKARELVKLLALAPGHRLHRDQAMDAFWRDKDPESAANNLHQAVHVARRVLGSDAIELHDELLGLRADVDADLFERAAVDARRAGTPAAYRAALSLYAGELLPENRYDDWAEERRAELADLHAALAEELDELGVVEGLRGLPTETTSFVGRERELRELAALLGRTRLLTLTGAGGAGKTRLALELARAVEGSYGDGAVLVELAPVADSGLVPGALAAALDVRALPGRDLASAVAAFLAPRSVLLVLDNCEHVVGASAALADALLRAAPRLTIVATSREPLRAPGEIVFRVPSLAMPDPAAAPPLHDLPGYESVRLFVERAAAAAPGFVLDEENAADVVRICFRLDGLPLALELAAGRIAALSPRAISERLDDRFRLLRTGSHAAPTRQQTLTAALQWSHDLLEDDERMLLRRLAVFAGGFELEAVESVCGSGEPSASATADVLARLAEKSLVTVEEGDGSRRYRLLETVRMYARERLDEAGEAAALAARHAEWAVALAGREQGSARLDKEASNLRAALDTLLERRSRDALRLCVALSPFWLRRIELDEAKRRLAGALDVVPERTPLRAEALLAAAAIDFRSGALSHSMALAEESYAVSSALEDRRGEWRALQFLGELGVATDAADVALPWLEKALAVARSEGLAAAEAIGVHSLGVAQWILGDLPSADRLLAQSMESFRTLEDSPETIPSPLNIAEIRMRHPQGLPGLRLVFEDTLQPFTEIGCDAAASYVLANRAAIARARGDFARTHALLDESAARFERAGDEAGRATVLVRRAYVALAEGDLASARARLEGALELRGRLSDRRGLGLVLAGLGLIDMTSGDYDAAERHLAEARGIFRRAGDRWGLASTLWRTADLALARGNLDEAEAALQEALSVLGETQRERWIATTLTGLADVALLREDLERASSLLADARDRYAMRDDALGVASVDERLRLLAKEPLRRGKGARDRNTRTAKAKGGRT